MRAVGGAERRCGEVEQARPRGRRERRRRARQATRAALDIERVSARANTAGLAVDVRLRGDFERLAGSGALKGAVPRSDPTQGWPLRQAGHERRRPPRPVALRARRRRPGRRARRAPGPFRVAGDVSTVTSVRVRVAAARQDARGSGLGRRGGVVRPARADRQTSLPGLRRRGDRPRAAARAASCARSAASRRRPAGRACCGSAPARGLPVRARQADPLRLPDAAGALQPRRHRVTDEPDADLALHRQPARPGLQGGPDADLRRRRLDATPTARSAPTCGPTATRRTRSLRGQDEPLVRRPGHVPDHAQHQRPVGGTAFTSKTLFVGGSGAKALRNPDNSRSGSTARRRARSRAAAPSR